MNSQWTRSWKNSVRTAQFGDAHGDFSNIVDMSRWSASSS